MARVGNEYARNGVDRIHRQTKGCLERREEHRTEVIRSAKQYGLCGEGIRGEQPTQVSDDCLEERSIGVLDGGSDVVG